MVQDTQKAGEKEMFFSFDAGVPKRQCRAERLAVKETSHPTRDRPQVLISGLRECEIPGLFQGALGRYQADGWKEFRASEQNGVGIPVADCDSASTGRGLHGDGTATAKRVDDEFPLG